VRGNRAAALVQLRFFAGVEHQEAAEVLGIGRRAADSLRLFARFRLYQALAEDLGSCAQLPDLLGTFL